MKNKLRKITSSRRFQSIQTAAGLFAQRLRTRIWCCLGMQWLLRKDLRLGMSRLTHSCTNACKSANSDGAPGSKPCLTVVMASALDFENMLRNTLLSSTALTAIVGNKVFPRWSCRRILLPRQYLQKISGVPANCPLWANWLGRNNGANRRMGHEPERCKKHGKGNSRRHAAGATWGARLTMDEGFV